MIAQIFKKKVASYNTWWGTIMIPQLEFHPFSAIRAIEICVQLCDKLLRLTYKITWLILKNRPWLLLQFYLFLDERRNFVLKEKEEMMKNSPNLCQSGIDSPRKLHGRLQQRKNDDSAPKEDWRTRAITKDLSIPIHPNNPTSSKTATLPKHLTTLLPTRTWFKITIINK